MHLSKTPVTGHKMAAPIHFHKNHSKQILTSHNQKHIFRSPSTPFFLKTRAFTSRPLALNEPIHFRLLKIASDYGAFVHIGYTTRNPSNHPLNLKPNCQTCTFQLPTKFCRQNTTLTFHLTSNHQPFYAIDGQGALPLANAPYKREASPVWCLIDFYGNLQQVELISSADFAPILTFAHQPTSIEFKPLELSRRTKGSSILLVASDKCRRTNANRSQGFVFSAQPIETDHHYVIKVDARQANDFNLKIGLTACDPSQVVHVLPNNTLTILNRPEFWVMVGETSARAMDEFGLTVTAFSEVRWSINGRIREFVTVGGARGGDLWLWLAVEGACEGVSVAGGRWEVGNFRLGVKNGGEECLVCLDAKTSAVLYDCGHVCMCYGCALEQWRGKGGGACPLCRKIILDVLRIDK